MAEKRFNLVFSGKLVEGRQPQEVLSKLCTVLEMEQPQVREIFKGGFGAVILKELDGQKAYAMREECREAGAVCTVQEIIPLKTEPSTGDMRTMEAPRQARPGQRPLQDSGLRRPPATVVEASGSGSGALIFKLILVAVLVGGGWWGYQRYLAPPSPAFQVYSLFAEALAREEYQKAAEVSTGQARSHADGLIRMMAPSSMKLYGREFSLSKPSISSIAGDIAWIKYKRKEEKQADSGSVSLQVEETVCRIPPGVASTLCKWPVTFLDEVEVAQADGVWKVSSFKEERLTPQQ